MKACVQYCRHIHHPAQCDFYKKAKCSHFLDFVRAENPELPHQKYRDGQTQWIQKRRCTFFSYGCTVKCIRAHFLRKKHTMQRNPDEAANPEIDIESLTTQDGVALYRLLLHDPNATIVTPEERKSAKARLRYILKKRPGVITLCQALLAQDAYLRLQFVLRQMEAN